MDLKRITRIEFEADVWEYNPDQGKDYMARAVVSGYLEAGDTPTVGLVITDIWRKEDN